jgi:RNA polymerase sigma-70 factor, ECF subfamily
MTLSTEPGAADPNGASDPQGLSPALERQLMSAAVAQLPAEYRAVLRRSFYQGWTTQQIADDLQIADSTVKTRLHFAVRALQSSFQELVAGATTQSRSAYPLCPGPPAAGSPTRFGMAC